MHFLCTGTYVHNLLTLWQMDVSNLLGVYMLLLLLAASCPSASSRHVCYPTRQNRKINSCFICARDCCCLRLHWCHDGSWCCCCFALAPLLHHVPPPIFIFTLIKLKKNKNWHMNDTENEFLFAVDCAGFGACGYNICLSRNLTEALFCGRLGRAAHTLFSTHFL